MLVARDTCRLEDPTRVRVTDFKPRAVVTITASATILPLCLLSVLRTCDMLWRMQLACAWGNGHFGKIAADHCKGDIDIAMLASR